MTESEWLECTDPTPMLEFLRGKASERKLRLLCVALCRHIWDLLTDADCRNAVEVTERFADGLATQDELESAYSNTTTATTAANKAAGWTADSPFQFYHASETAVCVLDAVTLFARRSSFDVENQIHIGILLDLFGNPFRPVSIDPDWLTPTVITLAQSAYEERIMPTGELDAARLAVLSDALEESGCDDEEILNHLRSAGPHVRGCWAIDLLLGKS
jgi:hypothetical protein